MEAHSDRVAGDPPLSAVGEWLLIVSYALFFLILLGLTVLTLLWIFQR